MTFASIFVIILAVLSTVAVVYYSPYVIGLATLETARNDQTDAGLVSLVVAVIAWAIVFQCDVALL